MALFVVCPQLRRVAPGTLFEAALPGLTGPMVVSIGLFLNVAAVGHEHPAGIADGSSALRREGDEPSPRFLGTRLPENYDGITVTGITELR
jgi:hypothetical protein